MAGSTVANNELQGIWSVSSPGSSALTIHNSIVAGSRGLDGEPIEDVRTTGDAPQVTHSLIENLGSVTPEEITGISNLLNVDPMLGTLADNGGPTRTHALLPSSLAIDAAGLTSHAFDQRGFPRVVDLPSLPNGPHGAADIGAFEHVQKAAYMQFAERVASGERLLMICDEPGSENAGELWSRQAGAWLYLPSPEFTDGFVQLLRDARGIAEKIAGDSTAGV